MRRVNLSIGVAFLLAALALGFNAVSLGYYSRLGPGPGFFPLWLCILLALLSGGVLLQAALAAPEPLPGAFFTTRANYLRIAAVILLLFAVALSMRALGFRWTMLGFYLIMLTLLGRRNPFEILALSLLGSFGAYYLFADLLGQALPIGPLGI